MDETLALVLQPCFAESPYKAHDRVQSANRQASRHK